MLSQDAYGARTTLSLKGASVPLPDLAVGRLVETPAEITGALTRYAALGGTLPTPHASLVTGYDFLTDAADAVQAHWQAGLGAGARTDTLITDQDVPPSTTTVNGVPDRRHSWTAADLRAALLTGARHDLVYLAGHFSANSALAADSATSLVTTEVRDSAVDLRDSLVLSAGCHSGYNIADTDGVPGLTLGLDWAQLMAQKGATLVAGTGYQYGDTDFLEYSERLYADLAGQLRVGTGAVPLGRALVLAKQRYLATTPVLDGLHQKALLEATLYGLPMLGLDLPAGRTPAVVPSAASATPVASGPGASLSLSARDLALTPVTTVVDRDLTDVDGTGLTHFTYLTGADGVTTSPGSRRCRWRAWTSRSRASRCAGSASAAAATPTCPGSCRWPAPPRRSTARCTPPSARRCSSPAGSPP